MGIVDAKIMALRIGGRGYGDDSNIFILKYYVRSIS